MRKSVEHVGEVKAINTSIQGIEVHETARIWHMRLLTEHTGSDRKNDRDRGSKPRLGRTGVRNVDQLAKLVFGSKYVIDRNRHESRRDRNVTAENR